MRNIAINPLSLGMSQLIYNLQGSWNLIERFLNTPERVMKEYDLKEDEKRALLTRDTEQLAKLGVDQQFAMAATSGRHSLTCSYNCGGGGNKQLPSG